MLICEAAEKAYREGVVRALNEYYPDKALGTRYMEYIGYRSIGVLPNGYFADRKGLDGTYHIMTPQEALEKYSQGRNNLKEDAAYYATQKFINWWQKEVSPDHPALEHCAYYKIDPQGRIYCADEDGNVVDYFSTETSESELALA